jgi:exoribonuclease-2
VAQAGAVVAFWEGGGLQFAVSGGEEKQRIRLVLPGGREERVAAARIALVVESSGQAPGKDPEGCRMAGRRAGAVAERVSSLAARVEVPVIWDLVVDEPEAASLGSLSVLALGEDTGEARAGVTLAFVRDALHFVRRGETWEPRPREIVTDLCSQRERAARRASERTQALSALSALQRGETWSASESEEERAILHALEEAALQPGACPESARTLALSALEAAGQRFERIDEGAVQLLVRLGRFAPDENLEVRRYGLRTAFPEEVLAAAEAAARRGFEREGRLDLTGEAVLTIDAAHTREVDDGLSLTALPDGGVRLGIHIADPSAFVFPGDPVDVEALLRSTTHYLPDQKLTMLPPALGERAASLLVGEDRPALSFLLEMGPAGEIRGGGPVRSIVRAAARLSYDEADAALVSGEGKWAPLLRAWADAAAKLEAGRAAAGAVRLLSAEVDVRARDGVIELERLPAESPSRRLVAEAMVQAGAAAARFCLERGLPAIYRRQAPPTGPLAEGGQPITDPVRIRQVRRMLRRAEVGIHPGVHAGLGLPAYAQATSPLRRYQDLATTRQIGAVLAAGAPIHAASELQRMAATTERAEAEGRRAERASEAYWLLRYLEGRVGEVVAGLVVEVDPAPVVLLEETLLEERMPSLSGLPPGSRVSLRIERVNPRAGRLFLRREDAL